MTLCQTDVFFYDAIIQLFSLALDSGGNTFTTQEHRHKANTGLQNFALMPSGSASLL